jgi:hypothetical protein
MQNNKFYDIYNSLKPGVQKFLLHIKDEFDKTNDIQKAKELLNTLELAQHLIKSEENFIATGKKVTGTGKSISDEVFTTGNQETTQQLTTNQQKNFDSNKSEARNTQEWFIKKWGYNTRTLGVSPGHLLTDLLVAAVARIFGQSLNAPKVRLLVNDQGEIVASASQKVLYDKAENKYLDNFKNLDGFFQEISRAQNLFKRISSEEQKNFEKLSKQFQELPVKEKNLLFDYYKQSIIRDLILGNDGAPRNMATGTKNEEFKLASYDFDSAGNSEDNSKIIAGNIEKLITEVGTTEDQAKLERLRQEVVKEFITNEKIIEKLLLKLQVIIGPAEASYPSLVKKYVDEDIMIGWKDFELDPLLRYGSEFPTGEETITNYFTALKNKFNEFIQEYNLTETYSLYQKSDTNNYKDNKKAFIKGYHKKKKEAPIKWYVNDHDDNKQTFVDLVSKPSQDVPGFGKSQ